MAFSTTTAAQMPKAKGVRRGFEDPKSISDKAEGWEQKINFNNLRLYNKRHLREHKKSGEKSKYIHHYGVRPTAIQQIGTWEAIPEMVPQLGNIITSKIIIRLLKPFIT